MKPRYLLLASVFLVVACSDEAVRSAAKFEVGSLVESVVGARVGMVTDRYCPLYRETEKAKPCRYEIRFAALTATTDTSIFGDGPVTLSPFATVWMSEFELRARKLAGE